MDLLREEELVEKTMPVSGGSRRKTRRHRKKTHKKGGCWGDWKKGGKKTRGKKSRGRGKFRLTGGIPMI